MDAPQKVSAISAKQRGSKSRSFSDRLFAKLMFGSLLLLVLPVLTKYVNARASVNKSSLKDAWIDPMSHDVMVLTPATYESKLKKFRHSQLSVVLFYNKIEEAMMPKQMSLRNKKEDTDEDDVALHGSAGITVRKYLAGVYNDMASSIRGMANVFAVDCDDFPKFCDDNNVHKYRPSIVIYPLSPFPEYLYQNQISPSSFSKLSFELTRQIQSTHVTIVDNTNIDTFLTQQIALPKVLLFYEKKNVPVLYKSLANEFAAKLDFGFIESSKDEGGAIGKRYGVRAYPTVLVLKFEAKLNKHAPALYKGKTFKYYPLHDFLNVFAETFVKGGGFTEHSHTSTAAKPWLAQRIPEVTKESHGDICFSKSDKSMGLCVIFLKDGAALAAEETLMLETLNEQFTSQLADRGARFRWMWMNVGLEKGFNEMFEVEGALPSVVVFNPHKRLRFTKLPSDQSATSDNIKNLLDKIAGGDARFKNVKGQALPEFAERAPVDEKKEEL